MCFSVVTFVTLLIQEFECLQMLRIDFYFFVLQKC